jgi:hypothetical protein
VQNLKKSGVKINRKSKSRTCDGWGWYAKYTLDVLTEKITPETGNCLRGKYIREIGSRI